MSAIRTALEGIIKNTVGSIKILKVSGSDAETRIQGVDVNKKVFLEAKLASPLVDFAGEFGIGNIDLLKGLLNLGSYKADKATISVKRRPQANAVETIEFRDDGKIGSDFRCMSPEQVPPQAEIGKFPYDIVFKPNAGKIAEFAQLAGLFGGGEIKDHLFELKVDNGRLVATFGSDSAATHHGSLVLEEGITAVLKTPLLFSHADFISLLKLAGGQDVTVKIAQRPPVMCVEIAAQIGSFQYYLRKWER